MIQDLKIGDKVSSMGDQCAIPDIHRVRGTTYDGYRAVGSSPTIYLSNLNRGGHGMPEFWAINTNLLNNGGLVCFLPEPFLHVPVFEVEITKILDKAVLGIPTSWLYCEGITDMELYTGDSISTLLTQLRDMKPAKIAVIKS